MSPAAAERDGPSRGERDDAGGPDGAGGGAPGILLARFHSLGDVVLTTGVGAALSHAGARVEVLTETRFTPIFDGLPWVERLWTREALESGAARPGPFSHVVDLQGTPGSRRTLAPLAPRGVLSRIRTRAGERRWVVLWGDRFPRPAVPHAVRRYAEAVRQLAISRDAHALRPAMAVTLAEEAEARRMAPAAFEAPAATAVALVAGASRRSKAYPTESLLRVADRLEAAGHPVWWFEPPERANPSSADLASSDRTAAPGTRPGGWRFRLPLGPLKAVLGRAAMTVVSDSGPMHVAVALGVPVVAIFGSSVERFGFAPLGPQDRVLQVEGLACRPCGVHGRNRCWLGHWRCLREVRPEDVAAAALEILDGRSRTAHRAMPGGAAEVRA